MPFVGKMITWEIVCITFYHLNFHTIQHLPAQRNVISSPNSVTVKEVMRERVTLVLCRNWVRSCCQLKWRSYTRPWEEQLTSLRLLSKSSSLKVRAFCLQIIRLLMHSRSSTKGKRLLLSLENASFYPISSLFWCYSTLAITCDTVLHFKIVSSFQKLVTTESVLAALGPWGMGFWVAFLEAAIWMCPQGY